MVVTNQRRWVHGRQV